MAAILAATLAGAGTALLGTHPATAADAGVVRVTAAADTYVSSGRRAGTFGTLDKLVIGRLAGDTKTSYLKFSVDADSVNGSVRAARLRLVAVGGVAAGAVSLSPVLDTSWSQASMTSANAPALSAATRAGTVSGAGVGAQVSFDLTGLVTKPGVYAFAVRSAGSAVTRFRSSEAASGGPELTLTPTKPIPAQPAPTKPIPAQPAPT
jgi:hypothetical protein